MYPTFLPPVSVSYIDVFVIARRAASLKLDKRTAVQNRETSLKQHEDKSDAKRNRPFHSQNSFSRVTFTAYGTNETLNDSSMRESRYSTQHCTTSKLIRETNKITLLSSTSPSAISIESSVHSQTNEIKKFGADSTLEMNKYLLLKRKRSLRKQLHIALTLFCVTFTFIVGYLPSAVLDLRAWGIELGSNASDAQVEVLLGLFWFSVPANPAIYAFTSPRFRKETKLLAQRIRSCHISFDDSI